MVIIYYIFLFLGEYDWVKDFTNIIWEYIKVRLRVGMFIWEVFKEGKNGYIW